jgi:hypothetical protein
MYSIHSNAKLKLNIFKQIVYQVVHSVKSKSLFMSNFMSTVVLYKLNCVFKF